VFWIRPLATKTPEGGRKNLRQQRYADAANKLPQRSIRNDRGSAMSESTEYFAATARPSTSLDKSSYKRSGTSIIPRTSRRGGPRGKTRLGGGLFLFFYFFFFLGGGPTDRGKQEARLDSPTATNTRLDNT